MENSALFKERLDEIQTIEFFFGSQSGIIDLSDVNFDAILENETVEAKVDFYEYTVLLNLSNGVFLCENFLPPDSWGTNDMVLRVIVRDKNGLSTEESFTMFYSNGMPLIEMKEPKNETHYFSAHAKNQINLETSIEKSLKSIERIEYKVVDKNSENTVYIQKEIVRNPENELPKKISDTIDLSSIESDCKLVFRVFDVDGGMNEVYRIFNFDGEAPIVHDVGIKKHGSPEYSDAPAYLKKDDLFDIRFKVSDNPGGAGLAESENIVSVGIQNKTSTKIDCQKNDDGYYYAKFQLTEAQDSFQIPFQFYLTDKLNNSTNGNTPGSWDSIIRYYSKALLQNEVINGLTLDGYLKNSNSIITAIGTFQDQLSIDLECERDLDFKQCYVDFNSGNDEDVQYFDDSENKPDDKPSNVTFNKLSSSLSGDSLALNIYLTDMAGNSYEYQNINENVTAIILDNSPPIIGVPELSLSEDKWLYKNGYIIFGNVDEFILKVPISDVSPVASASAQMIVDGNEVITAQVVVENGNYTFKFPREELVNVDDGHAITLRINANDHYYLNDDLSPTHFISNEYTFFEAKNVKETISGMSSAAELKLDYQEPENMSPTVQYIENEVIARLNPLLEAGYVAKVQYEFKRGEDIIFDITEDYDEGDVLEYKRIILDNSDILQGTLTCNITAWDFFGNKSIQVECPGNIKIDYESLSIENIEWVSDGNTFCGGSEVESIITFNEKLKKIREIFYRFVDGDNETLVKEVQDISENLKSATENDWIVKMTIPPGNPTSGEPENIIANRISVLATGTDVYGNESSVSSQEGQFYIENVPPVVTGISTENSYGQKGSCVYGHGQRFWGGPSRECGA